MRAHVLQHAPFEGPGSIGDWLAARRAVVRVSRLFAGDPLPTTEAFDLLIALGGPMSVNDEANMAWLAPEKALVREAIAREIPIVGVCLGAQLIASALGACVYRSQTREIGWFSVQAVPASVPTFTFPAACTAFHWHSETFDLPDRATRLASSLPCANQAFQVGPNAVGLQFHLETTPASLDAILRGCRHELTPDQIDPCVQTEERIRAAPAAHYKAINGLMGTLLDYLVTVR